MSGEPFPKSRQLARGSRRYWRGIAGPKKWQALQDEKHGPCRVCERSLLIAPVGLHHVVPRDQAGDDTADNLVPLCRQCHDRIHLREQIAALSLFQSLTDAEYAYAVDRAGEDVWQRVYGLGAAYTDPTASRKAKP